MLVMVGSYNADDIVSKKLKSKNTYFTIIYLVKVFLYNDP